LNAYLKALLVILGVLLLDQGSKLWIRNTMYMGQEIDVIGNWFKLHFTENKGIAFGIEFGGRIGKVFLTLFRMVAAGLIGYYLYYLIQNRAKTGLIICLSLILAGALGNILDSLFYGLIFNYEALFHGRVVDMLYFPLFEGHFPPWLPAWGGDYFIFFRPVFNIADTAITTGVIVILLFYRNVFQDF